MTQTLRDSLIPYDNITSWVTNNPCKYNPDDQDIILTCPVRLAFVHLENAQKNKTDSGDENETFNVVALFPPQATGQVDSFLRPIWREHTLRDFPKFAYNGEPTDEVHNPFYDQKKKIRYDGYTAGAYFLNVGSKFRPAIIDANQQKIVEGPAFASRVYDGCWAILGLRVYSFGKKADAKNRGVKFGLVAVMIIADDQKFVGKEVDAKETFSSVKIEKSFSVGSAFSTQESPPAPPAASIIPTSGPAGTAAPATYTPPAQWPQGFPPDQMVAAGWTRQALLSAGYEAKDLAHYGVN